MTNKKSKEKVNNRKLSMPIDKNDWKLLHRDEKKNKPRRGAPDKEADKKVDPVNHLWVWQSKRLKEEAAIRNISDAAMLRMGWDWFITALDTGRADVTASKLFDDKFTNNKEIENG